MKKIYNKPEIVCVSCDLEHVIAASPEPADHGSSLDGGSPTDGGKTSDTDRDGNAYDPGNGRAKGWNFDEDWDLPGWE